MQGYKRGAAEALGHLDEEIEKQAKVAYAKHAGDHEAELQKDISSSMSNFLKTRKR